MPRVHGILVQAPLPKHIRQEVVYATVLPTKDVDGFHPVNVGKLMLGRCNRFSTLHPGGRARIARARRGEDRRARKS